jgi:hypothetical protein
MCVSVGACAKGVAAGQGNGQEAAKQEAAKQETAKGK